MASSQTPPPSHAELYRADFISAMKLPDTQHFEPSSYLNIKDPWRTEWEKGVQVCMHPESIQKPTVRCRESESASSEEDFVMPAEYIPDESGLNHMPQYDLDELDLGWLDTFRERRKYSGLIGGQQQASEETLRQAISTLEVRCQHNMAYTMATREDLKMEVDEAAGCDVCHKYEAEDANVMVFCDVCNVCVHQACYGVGSIPDGSWLCDVCRTKEATPKCALCPNMGGAMKQTGDGAGWAHVNCALWIPEVEFGSTEHMKPILLDRVPAKRWNLVCSLCRKKEGACVQCFCATCTVAYHVTCGFFSGLEMKATNDTGNSLIYETYCPKHTALRKAIRTPSPRKDLRLSNKVRNLEEEFYCHATATDLQREMGLTPKLSTLLYNYWKLKRISNQNRPLVAAMSVDSLRLELLQQSHDIAQKKANFDHLVHMRHDLEKVRNLVYMMQKRERLKKRIVLTDEEIVWRRMKNVEEVQKRKEEEEERPPSVASSAEVDMAECEMDVLVQNGSEKRKSNCRVDGFKPPRLLPVAKQRFTRQSLKQNHKIHLNSHKSHRLTNHSETSYTHSLRTRPLVSDAAGGNKLRLQ